LAPLTPAAIICSMIILGTLPQGRALDLGWRGGINSAVIMSPIRNQLQGTQAEQDGWGEKVERGLAGGLLFLGV
jgi:hypothetical protein